MTSEALDTLSLSPVQNGEERDLPTEEDMGGLKSSLTIVEEILSSPIPLGPLTSRDVDERKDTMEEHAKASMCIFIEVEEISLPLTPLETFHDAKGRPSTTEVHVEALGTPLAKVEEQASRYHEDDTAQYCLPNEQVQPKWSKAHMLS